MVPFYLNNPLIVFKFSVNSLISREVIVTSCIIIKGNLCLAAEVFYILIPPPFQVSTAWAYGQVSGRINFALTGQSKYVNFINSIADRPICPRTLFACMENDFEPVVADVWPALNEIREALRTAGAAACCMTGSGSVMFGAFFEASTAHRAAAVLQGAGYRAFLCRPLVKDVERG